MFGPDGAGKTAVLYQMKRGKSVTTIPTIGFIMETVKSNGLDVELCDVSGQNPIRWLWRHFFEWGRKCLIFVVDSNDLGWMGLFSRDELHKLLNGDDLKNAILLVYANKQDLLNALNPDEITNGLGLASMESRAWNVQSVCAATGYGLFEGLDWLVEQHIKKI
jgi:signal recognition particle receptor subunit beta